MNEVVINKDAVLIELCRRVSDNEQGVRAHLSESGIVVAPGEVTVQDLNRLREINPKSFDSLIRFLYPEVKEIANDDGDNTTATVTTKSGEKWSASDITGVIGTVLSAATGILGTLNLNGNTRAIADANIAAANERSYQEEHDKRQVWITLGIVLGILVLFVVAFTIIFKGRRF